jgi:hypothetical protein
VTSTGPWIIVLIFYFVHFTGRSGEIVRHEIDEKKQRVMENKIVQLQVTLDRKNKVIKKFKAMDDEKF